MNKSEPPTRPSVDVPLSEMLIPQWSNRPSFHILFLFWTHNNCNMIRARNKWIKKENGERKGTDEDKGANKIKIKRSKIEKDNVTCISIARQRVSKHIPATHEHGTIGRLLLGNGAIKRLRQQYRLCSPWGPCNVVIRSVRHYSCSRRSIEQ
jgi:hypothetical protein